MWVIVYRKATSFNYSSGELSLTAFVSVYIHSGPWYALFFPL